MGLLKKRKKDNNYLFTNKMLIALFVPLVVEQFLAVLVGMADSMMIANVGEAAVSGVSLVDQIMVLFIALFSALATGGAIVAGQYMGMQREKDACRASTQLVWFVTFLSLLVMIGIYFGKYVILHVVFGTIDENVRSNANIYLLIVTASIPFLALYNSGAAVFRVQGNSKISMKISILMNIINVGGNAILIYGFHRGTEGVAIPTLISRIVAAVLIIILLVNPKYQLHIDKSLRFHPDFLIIKRILQIGVPNGLENAMFQIGKVLVLSLVSSFGTYAITANAVSNAITVFEILPGVAIGIGVTTVIARCVGAGEMEQVKYYTRKILLITYISVFLFDAITVGSLSFLLNLYHLSATTAALTNQIILFYSLASITVWPLAFTLPNMLRATGDVQYTMWISMIAMWTFRIGFSFLLGRYMHMGVFGVWVAMIIDWCFRAVFMSLRYLSGKWKYQMRLS